MAFTSTPGTPFTWDTAGFSWNDADAGKAWDDASPFVYVGTLDETVNLAEAPSNRPYKSFDETVHYTERWTKKTGKTLAELLGLAELYSSIEEFNPMFAESFYVVDLLLKEYNQSLEESAAVEDAKPTAVRLSKLEAFNLVEDYANTLAWSRILAENFLFSESYHRALGVNKPEAFNVQDTFVRQGPMIVSDLQLRGDEVTLGSFLLNVQNNVPSGYGPFQPFVIGDYDITKALIKITMQRESPAQDLRLLSGKVFIDVADVTDRGNITISTTAGPVTIAFTRKFLIPPVVSVTRIGSSGGASPRITNVTRTNFQIELVDSSGNRVLGDANWQAEGY